MLISTRQGSILRRIQETGDVSVLQLAADLGVSPSTIRRDLNLLSREGHMRRVHGGGALDSDKIPFHEVLARGSATKEKIAVRAAGLVNDGDVVLLDIGTTTAMLARALRGRQITVMTSSIAVLDELRTDSEVELIILGGVLRRSYHSLVGSLTLESLAQVRSTISFLGCSGIRPDTTVQDTTSIEVPVKQAILGTSARVVLLADETKFPGVGVRDVCTASRIATLVTCDGADPDTLAAFKQAGSEVILA
ncbi:DeoR/GlpR family DNA-binding transcription regulator [Paeniglutamicibacter cryotolerans]|uniref:Lactose phosphotransferase system repressor n=1 Tax=Paeniglutamicibacter cryotolerans TaxID=670079 RepID=A0A839QNZ2_9MICC|nr:DeoR/GlpR family DNA-binding transcription regulator [Paeniglutamicibacter cryotolerans]MBB2996494.1 DeoR/GlpR family transcriptional regulator of sugar metabolism [Paeniglutamicibacter cryotolerans]